MSVVSTLVVKLTADSRGLKQALTTSEKDVSKWGKAHRVATAGAAAGLTAITGVAVKSMGTYKDFGGAVNKLSGLMNVSTEDASRLVGQWKRFGIETGTGVTAVKFLSRNIAAAKAGNRAAIDSFAKLGISVKDLGRMSAAEVMMEARDAMSQMEDKTARTATMLKLFGRSGTEMLGWVKQAPGDIAGVNKSLDKLGLVWGDKQLTTYKDLAKAQAENKLVWMGFQMTLAQTLVPTLTDILGLFQKVLWAIQPVAPVLKYVAAGLAGFLIAGKLASMGTAIVGFAKSIRIAAAAQWLWNTAMSANPLALVIIGLVALGVALVVAYKKSATFRKIVQAAFRGVLGVVKTVVGALVNAVRWCWDKMKAIWAGLEWLVGYFRKNWRLILTAVTGPGGAIVAFLVRNWDKVKAVTGAAFGWVKGKISDAWKAILRGLVWYGEKFRAVWRGIWDAVKRIGSGIWDSITGVFRGGYNTVVGWLNKLIGAVNWVLGKIGATKLPGLATAKGDGDGIIRAAGGGPRKGDSLLGTGKKVAGKLPSGDSLLGSVTSWVGDKLGDLADFLHLPSFPELPKLPVFLAKLPAYVLRRMVDWLKKKLSSGSAAGLPVGKGYAWAQSLARRFGLAVTSTYRPGAITASGYKSYHSVYGKAADLAGPAANMMRLANALFANPRGWAEIIYQHRGYSASRGGAYYFPRNDHFDHVHVARQMGDGWGIPTPAPAAPSVYVDQRGAILVDSSREGIERLWRLTVAGGAVVSSRREKVNPR